MGRGGRVQVPAVGAVVPWARGGDGAVATQATRTSGTARDGLELLAAGRRRGEVVAELTGQTTCERSPAGRGRCARRRRQLHGSRVHRLGGRAQRCRLRGAGQRAGRAGGGRRPGRGLPGQRRLAGGATVGRAAGRRPRRRRPPRQAVGGADRPAEGAGYGGNNDILVDLRVDDHPDPVAELGRLLGDPPAAVRQDAARRVPSARGRTRGRGATSCSGSAARRPWRSGRRSRTSRNGSGRTGRASTRWCSTSCERAGRTPRQAAPADLSQKRDRFPVFHNKAWAPIIRPPAGAAQPCGSTRHKSVPILHVRSDKAWSPNHSPRRWRARSGRRACERRELAQRERFADPLGAGARPQDARAARRRSRVPRAPTARPDPRPRAAFPRRTRRAADRPAAPGRAAARPARRPAPAAALAERPRHLAAARADEVAHVLDHRGHAHAGLRRHIGRAPCDLLRGRLGRRHDQQVGLGQQLPSEIEMSPVPGGMSTTR